MFTLAEALGGWAQLSFKRSLKMWALWAGQEDHVGLTSSSFGLELPRRSDL